MSPDTHSAFIAFPGGGHAFIDGIPDTCEHDWNGDPVYVSRSGKVVYWHTYRQWASLCSDARARLIQEYHFSIEDPIVQAASSCRKCKKVFHPGYF
jgi:hypothetical protein